ncbi:hypothetical protein IEO21_04137 [Rhodonia placenta]|uniref:Uncharacterized protein n=1 Tax=Rhodonia placenta TaxID=104341 RepID=A0A8H7P4N8_9APHY|nr:hypothetical protein IEO21_04137 [Postia placenta]
MPSRFLARNDMNVGKCKSVTHGFPLCLIDIFTVEVENSHDPYMSPSRRLCRFLRGGQSPAIPRPIYSPKKVCKRAAAILQLGASSPSPKEKPHSFGQKVPPSPLSLSLESIQLPVLDGSLMRHIALYHAYIDYAKVILAWGQSWQGSDLQPVRVVIEQVSKSLNSPSLMLSTRTPDNRHGCFSRIECKSAHWIRCVNATVSECSKWDGRVSYPSYPYASFTSYDAWGPVRHEVSPWVIADLDWKTKFWFLHSSSNLDADSGMYQPRTPYGTLQRSARRLPRPPTSVALDDNFDAMTTEAPTEWNFGVIRRGRDYEESISGYQNYVNEMERKLSGEDQREREAAEKKAAAEALKRANRNIYGSELGRGSQRGGRAATPENARKVSGRQGKMELVESRVVEDGPNRTISLWRERVAESSSDGNPVEDDMLSGANPHTHRRVSSENVQTKRIISDGLGGVSSVSRGDSRRGLEMQKTGISSYERSEYMVAYHQPTKGGYPIPMYENTLPMLASGMGYAPMSPKSSQIGSRATLPGRRRASGRLSLDRTEFMMSYPQTPPRSGGSEESLTSPKPLQRQMSPANTRLSIPIDMGDVPNGQKTGFTSPAELILSSCEPSLVHLLPILTELGIQRMEHLRAIAKLSEETRNREVKEQALKRGMTVVEWAILLDKLHTL